MTVFDQGSQKERREIIEQAAKPHPSQTAREPSTHFEVASQPNPTKPYEPRPSLDMPRLPASSPWSSSGGTEPPLGYRIDDLEPTGTPAEVAESMRKYEDRR
jgi:hypothetical protein